MSPAELRHRLDGMIALGYDGDVRVLPEQDTELDGPVTLGSWLVTDVEGDGDHIVFRFRWVEL